MPTKGIVEENKSKMNKAIEVLADELKAVRTGRASTGLVENIRADYYGTPTPIKTIAALSTPQHDMILIKPFDPGSVKEIEKAIKNSDLSLAPIVDRGLIRLAIPPLNEERRRDLVTQVKQMGEQAKISVRNIRRDAIKHLEKQQKDKTITEDDLQHGKKQMDDITKECIDKVDSVVKHKSDEIMLD
ncbi:MAG: ribosome recycling factor [Phycisphaerae bacterium]|nr:ribosome recycling factor [Phycisphaerae bacterium]MDD5380013.1 ribosome recycling factor [Phycisphaerae bacterium]